MKMNYITLDNAVNDPLRKAFLSLFSEDNWQSESDAICTLASVLVELMKANNNRFNGADRQVLSELVDQLETVF